MSLILTGNAANVTTPLTATVTALSNNGSGAIRVTTSSAHFFGNNDLVHMAASPAVGDYNITVVDSTHFDLQGSTFTTTGTGTATDRSLTPQIQFPTDGDTASLQLSGMLSGLQSLCDRTQFLAEQRSKYRLYNQFSGTGGTPLPPYHSSPWSTNNNFTAASPVIIPGSVYTLQSLSDTPSGPAPQLVAGDALAVTITGTTYAVATAAANGVLSLSLGWTQDGTTLIGDGDTRVLVSAVGTGATAVYTPFSITTLLYVSNMGLTLPGTVSFCLAGFVDLAPGSGQINWFFVGPLSIAAYQYRANA